MFLTKKASTSIVCTISCLPLPQPTCMTCHLQALRTNSQRLSGRVFEQGLCYVLVTTRARRTSVGCPRALHPGLMIQTAHINHTPDTNTPKSTHFVCTHTKHCTQLPDPHPNSLGSGLLLLLFAVGSILAVQFRVRVFGGAVCAIICSTATVCPPARKHMTVPGSPLPQHHILCSILLLMRIIQPPACLRSCVGGMARRGGAEQGSRKRNM